MAGATQHRTRGKVQTPSTPSDDGTVAEAPLSELPGSNFQAEQKDKGPSHQTPHHDEIAPLGANVIEALRVVSKLEKLGLDKQQISLPKCVVLGQQSTGKSSVIEAISGIKTPRDTGTCTRCPLFIELQPSSDPRGTWRAEVLLLRQYDLATDVSHRGLDTEFKGWAPKTESDKIPFAETNNPAELEYLIRCAQRATLSPLENPASFLDPNFDIRPIHKTLFSPNIVCVTVSKPGLPPLSFYDLPGMIGQAESEEDAFTVPLVRNLVIKYIVDPEALVLVTCALENDVANSMAAGLAREMKVTGRCMGVLTKPDRLPPGESPRDLANILDGRRFAMGHGYFVVKNLNSDEIDRGLTHQDARRLEQQFFSTVAPWSTDLQPYQSRFGTINMQHFLSAELGKQVMLKLPIIHSQIEERLAVVDDDLSRIPDTPLHTAVRTVADVIQMFSSEVRSEMAGEYGHVSWNNTWEECQKTLWDDFLLLEPKMSIHGVRDKGLYQSMQPGRTADEAMIIDSDEDEIPETPSKKRKHVTTTKHESFTPVPSSSPLGTPRKSTAKPLQAMSSNSTSLNPSGNIASLRVSFKLDEVHQFLSTSSRSRVPGQIDPKVREDMMRAPLEHWPVVVNSFFDNLGRQLNSRIKLLFDKHFQEWKGSELYRASLAIVQSIVDNNLHEQRTTMAAESLEDECEGPHIFHKDIFESEKAAMLAKYAQARVKARLKVYYAEYEEHHGQEMPDPKKEKFKKDDRNMAHIQKEPYSHEISLVADISTYYMIAARRFHDSMTMRIQSKFFKQLRDKLRDQLQDELGIYDADRGPYNAQRLLAESPERLARRNILVARKKALVEGLQCFRDHCKEYEAQHGAAPAPPTQSNYRRPSAASPPVEEMDGVRMHSLPHRRAV